MDDRWRAFVDEKIKLEPTGAGSLIGSTFAIKDVFAIKGYKNGAGNPDWLKTHEKSTQNAEVIDRLLLNGAKMEGTTHTDELMYSLNGENFHYGTPVNPKSSNRIPGGSSSGSAVAVAAGLVDFALGTDTGGSVRIPSSYCGLYGFRPTQGVISVSGVIPLANSFDTVGWMARDPELLFKVGEVLINVQKSDDTFSNVFLAEDAWSLLEERYKNALLQSTITLFEENSLKSESITLSEQGLSAWSNAFRVLQGIEIWQEHGEWIAKDKPFFGPGISERFEWTSTLKKSDSELQIKCREHVKKFMSNTLGEDGVLIIPTAPGPAPLLNLYGEKAEQYRAKTMQLSCIAGLAGLPQVTIPLIEVDGLPIGLSFVASQHQDLKLLSFIKTVVK